MQILLGKRRKTGSSSSSKNSKPNQTEAKQNQIETEPNRSRANGVFLKTPNRYANSATTNEAYTQIAKRAELS